jgi:uncharacterized protein with von Willebrand factor type A (vWA) domain
MSKPRKVGRPRVHKAYAKSNIVPVRFKGDDLKQITAAAKAKNLTVSEFIRSTLKAAVNE